MPLLRCPQNPTPKYTGLCLLVRAIFPQEKDANPLPGVKGGQCSAQPHLLSLGTGATRCAQEEAKAQVRDMTG